MHNAIEFCIVFFGIDLAQVRKQDADNYHLRMLCCMPSISKSVELKVIKEKKVIKVYKELKMALLKHFGDLHCLQETLRNGEILPTISLGKTTIDKARVATLRKYLCGK